MHKKIWEKIAFLGVGVFGVALFFLLDLHSYLTLTFLKASLEHFRQLYLAHPLLIPGGYFILYTCVVALNLPGAAVMTLAGGALFGFWKGTLLVSFASTLGATMACFAARYLLGELIQKKFAITLAKINQGISQEGTVYLLTLRLIPIFPFFLINLLTGLTKIPLFRFYWISQLGMLPGTMVYINAGRELSKINSLESILSPSLITAFVLLGIFPLMIKKIMEVIRKKRHTA